jgi:hypothetical protein
MGGSTCAAIEDVRKRADADGKAWDFANNWSPGGFADKFTAKNKSDNAIVSILSNNFETISNTIIDNKCSNTVSVDQKNIWEGNPICWTSMFEFCKVTDQSIPPMERVKAQNACLAEISKFRNAPVSQENINESNQDCVINSAIQVLAKQEGTIDNAATLESLQKAKSFMSNNDSDNLNCSEVSNNISSKQYLTQLLKCHNETAIKQSNIIKNDCNPNLKSQINKNNTVQKCMITSGVITSTDQSAAIKNVTSLKNDQTADAFGSSKDSLIFLIAAVAVGVVAFVVIKAVGGGGNNQQQQQQQPPT